MNAIVKCHVMYSIIFYVNNLYLMELLYYLAFLDCNWLKFYKYFEVVPGETMRTTYYLGNRKKEIDNNHDVWRNKIG